MKLALIIIFLVTLLASVIFYLTTDSNLDEPANMPWHVKLIDDRHTEIFDITLNKTTLAQAREKFGQLDGIALFRNPQGEYSLEAYFGKVTIGPFGARIIANLQATQAELEKLSEHTIKRVKLENGSFKWTLKAENQVQQSARIINSLSYIPAYSGMDQQFILDRFGEPESREVVDETTQVWLYPEQGVRIMVDDDGMELFEYVSLAQFKAVIGEK